MLHEYTRNKSGGRDNCYADVIRYITGISQEGIPNFSQHEDFNAAVDCYLYAWDLTIRVYDPNIHSDIEEILHFGFNDSGVMHVVICDEKGELIYDPYPRGGSLVKDVEKAVIIPTNYVSGMSEINDGC